MSLTTALSAIFDDEVIFMEIVEVKRCFDGFVDVLDEPEIELDDGSISSKRDCNFSPISFCLCNT